MSRRDRRLVVLAAALATIALPAGIASTDLWPPNEPRVAEVAREMPGRDGWLIPELNGVPFLEEPPLFYWMQAAAYRAHGAPSTVAARIPATIAAGLGVAVTALLARSVGTSAALAALVLATAPEWWWMARSATPDTANATATAAALLAFFHAWRRGGVVLLAAAVLAAAAAFWLKSLLGIGLAVASAAVFLLAGGRGRLRWTGIICAGGALVAVAVAWLAAVARAQGADAVGFFVVTNHVERLVGGGRAGHVRPPWYYAWNLALDVLPWSVALPAALVAAWRRRRDPATLFVLLWAVVMTVALSVAATKTAHYLLPAYPAFAVLVAMWWTGRSEGGLDRTTRALLGVVAVVLYPVAILAFAALDPAALSAVGSTRERVAAVASALLATGPGALGWALAAVAGLGVLFIVAERAGRSGAAAALLGLSATVVHLCVTLVVLPRFDAVASARPFAEALGRAGDGGSALFAFGFDNREQLSPLLFYGRHALVEATSVRDLAAPLRGRACVVMPADARGNAAASLRERAAGERRIGDLRLVLVAGAEGGCPESERDAALTGSSRLQ